MDRNTQAPFYFYLCEDFDRSNGPPTLTLNLYLSNLNPNSNLNPQTFDTVRTVQNVLTS